MSSMFRLICMLLMVAMLAGCGSDSQSTTSDRGNGADPNRLSVLAGSEVKDIEPLLPQIQKATGVTINLTYTGTLSGIDSIESGDVSPDAAWFAQDHYFGMTDTKHLIKKSVKTMISPVILGVKISKARELGWTSRRVGWKDVESAIASKNFRFAMTSPATSNSGFSAVVGISSAFATSGDAVSTKDINKDRLTTFFSGQKLISGSSGWLADAYRGSEDSLDGMINYESVILSLNQGGTLRQKLLPIYPYDGTVVADYPLVLLNDAKADAYAKVTDYIRTPAFQKEIMLTTHRRPVLAQVPLAAEFGKTLLVDTPFPASRNTVDAMLDAYLNKHRIAAHTFYVLDKTGSMVATDGTNETRIQRVDDALNVLAGSDKSLTGRFARINDRERVTFITFSDRVEHDDTYQMAKVNDPRVYAAIKGLGAGLEADGGTAIYNALERALDEAAEDRDGRYKSIVVMTDGENNEGEDADAFVARYKVRKEKVRIFPIYIGEASSVELDRIARVTGGRSFDGRTESLPNVFKEIRGYQ